MGLNILLTTLDGRDHPEWDWSKMAGDREATALIAQLPCEVVNPLPPPDYEPHYRPTDFAAWRAATWPGVNPERWPLMIDLLERDAEFHLYFSI